MNENLKKTITLTAKAIVKAIRNGAPYQETLSWEIDNKEILFITIAKLPARYGRALVDELDQAVENIITKKEGRAPTEVVDHIPPRTGGNA